MRTRGERFREKILAVGGTGGGPPNVRFGGELRGGGKMTMKEREKKPLIEDYGVYRRGKTDDGEKRETKITFQQNKKLGSLSRSRNKKQ